MARNVYECMLIFDSNKFAQDSAGVSGAVSDHIAKLGGEVLVARLWNEQKLAYPIDNHRKGTYWLMYFSLDSAKLAEFKHQLGINESVLRNLTLKIDPRLVDALVAHAQGGGRSRPADAPPIPVGVDDIPE